MNGLPDVSRWGRAALLVGAVTAVALAAGTGPASAGSTVPPTSRAVTTTPASAPGVSAGSAPPTSAQAAAGTLPLPPGVNPGTPPEPHVISTFAGDLKGPRRSTPPGKVLSVPVAADVDGCDRNYGEPSQCVPKTLPAGQTDVCAYLAQHGMKGVRVKGADTRSVDRNRNGIVCD